MNITEFLIDNYIYIIIVIVLTIITVIGFLADKKKTSEKRENEELNDEFTLSDDVNNGFRLNDSSNSYMSNQSNLGVNNQVNYQNNMGGQSVNMGQPQVMIPNPVNPQPIINPNINNQAGNWQMPQAQTMYGKTINQMPNNINNQGIQQGMNMVANMNNNMMNNQGGVLPTMVNPNNNVGPIPVPVNPNNNVGPIPVPVNPNITSTPQPIPNEQMGTVPTQIPASVGEAPINYVYGQPPYNNNISNE